VPELKPFAKSSRGPGLTPPDVGLIGWTDAPEAVNSGFSPSAGTLLLARAMPAQAATAAALYVRVTTAGTGVANAYVGLYSAAGVLLGASAELSATLSSTGYKRVPLVAQAGRSLACSVGVPVWAGFLVGAYTALGLNRAGVAPDLLNGAGVLAGALRCGNVGAALTALPASFDPATMTLDDHPYMAVAP
jgi:hypothetical protein